MDFDIAIMADDTAPPSSAGIAGLPVPTDIYATASSVLASSTPTSSLSSAPTLVETTMPLDWYEHDWVTPACVGLFMYSIISFVLLFLLCAGGRLDSRLNLRSPSRARQRRQRDFWNQTDAEMATQQNPFPIQRQRSDSIATVMGNGDEAELAAIRQELQAAGINISERTLREQRRRHDEFEEAVHIINWPATQQMTEAQVDAAYEAELERVRRRRSMNEARYIARLTPEQRRARADAQIVENMRALGML